VVDWITTKFTNHPRTASPMNTLSIRTWVCNAAAVFSGAYGAVTGRAQQARCSRQTLYQHAREIEQRLQTSAIATPPAQVTAPTPTPAPTSTPTLDQTIQRRFAVNAFAMGISTRQIEDLLGVLLENQAPDHSTIGRWVAEAAQKAKPVLEALDAACLPEIQTLAFDEIFFGGDRPWSASSL
jgi:hypothetical protein